jgi:hypothetical protein
MNNTNANSKTIQQETGHFYIPQPLNTQGYQPIQKNQLEDSFSA